MLGAGAPSRDGNGMKLVARGVPGSDGATDDARVREGVLGLEAGGAGGTNAHPKSEASAAVSDGSASVSIGESDDVGLESGAGASSAVIAGARRTDAKVEISVCTCVEV